LLGSLSELRLTLLLARKPVAAAKVNLLPHVPGFNNTMEECGKRGEVEMVVGHMTPHDIKAD
jgi:hypothetical protein